MFGRVIILGVCLLCATAVDAQKNLLSQHSLTAQLSSVLIPMDQLTCALLMEKDTWTVTVMP